MPKVRPKFTTTPGWTEYFDGSQWNPLASQAWVNALPVTLTGDVTGSGQGSVITTLNPVINKSGNQVFNFSGTPDAFNFDLTIPNSTNKTVKLRLNRANTGLDAGYEFQFYAPTNGVDTFTFGYNSGGQFGAYYTIANNAKVITFTAFRLAGLADPVNATDATTLGYIETNIFNILNANTTGSLNISRLQGYPNNALMFLNGLGNWVNPLTIVTSDPNNLTSGFTVKNTNPAAVSAGLSVDSDQTGTGVQFGFNNSTHEAYVWASGSALLKFGTNSTARMRLLNNGTLDMMNNSIINCGNFDINNNTTGQLNISRLQGYPANANFFLKGDGSWDYLAKNAGYFLVPGTGTFSDHVLLVNSVGKFGAGKYNAVCYGDSGQAAAEFFYSGVLKSYIDKTGTLTSASDKNLKSSLRKKDIFQKDYLQRILDLDIYSYTWKGKKEAQSHAAQHVSVGVLYEDIERLFNGNALSQPKAREGFRCEDKNCPTCQAIMKGIKPTEMLWYLILAFQSFYHKEYLPLKESFHQKNQQKIAF